MEGVIIRLDFEKQTNRVATNFWLKFLCSTNKLDTIETFSRVFDMLCIHIYAPKKHVQLVLEGRIIRVHEAWRQLFGIVIIRLALIRTYSSGRWRFHVNGLDRNSIKLNDITSHQEKEKEHLFLFFCFCVSHAVRKNSHHHGLDFRSVADKKKTSQSAFIRTKQQEKVSYQKSAARHQVEQDSCVL